MGASCGSQNLWSTYAHLGSSSTSLPNQLVVGPALSLQEAVDAANAIGCGVEIQLSGRVVGDIHLAPRCADADQLGIRIQGPAELEGGIRVACTGEDCAWASIEQLDVTTVDDDAFDVSAGGRLSVIASSASVSGAYSNVLTAHGSSRLLALNVEGESTGADPAPPVAIVQDSAATLIGRGSFRAGDHPYDEALHLGGNNGGTVRATVVGHHLACRVSGQSAIDFEPGGGGEISLESALLRLDCGVDTDLDSSSERASWRSLSDRIPSLSFAAPMKSHTRFQLDLDASLPATLSLAVPIPSWVDGRGTDWVKVR